MATSKIERPWQSLFPNFPAHPGEGFHNSIFRGKNLGSAVTDAQWAAISSGTFDNLFIGDYWTINSMNWRIAAFDYWYHFGDTRCSTHHVVIVPEKPLVTGSGHWLHGSTNTSGGYVGTDFYAGTNGNTVKAQCREAIQAAFGADHVLTHREYLCNSAADGYEQAAAWYDSDVELMTERMVFGEQISGNARKPVDQPVMNTVDHMQLRLFALARSYIYANASRYWLRDLASAGRFVMIDSAGMVSPRAANDTSVYIRPVFAIA